MDFLKLSKFFRLNKRDFWQGLYVALLTAVFGLVKEMATAHGFDFGAYDWVALGQLVIQVTGLYLSKNLLSDAEGNPLGMQYIKTGVTKLGALVYTEKEY